MTAPLTAPTRVSAITVVSGSDLTLLANAVRALAMKGCTLPDRRTVKRTRTLVSQTMAKWAQRGLIVTVGRGKQTCRALAR